MESGLTGIIKGNSVSKKKCSFIGIGVQKSASTWVHRILEDHPEVNTSEPKELDYFSFNFTKGQDWYESHFALEDGLIKVNGEISPSYFNSKEAPVRAYEYNPDYKIIVTLRDPVERAYSNHLHQIRIKHYQGQDTLFETGLSIDPSYVAQSNYMTHIDKWLQLFPKNNLLILLQEDIGVDPEKEARKVYRFLSVSSDFVSQNQNIRANISHTEKLKGVDNALKFSANIVRKLHLEKLVEYIKSLSLIRALREQNYKHLNEVVAKPSPKTTEALMEGFSEEVLELAEFLGRDRLPWKTWEYATNKK